MSEKLYEILLESSTYIDIQKIFREHVNAVF